MKSLMQTLLGDDWHQLPPALQAHYAAGDSCDRGQLDVHFPAALKPLFWLLSRMGALLDCTGRDLPTEVRKHDQAGQQRWQRTIQYPDGKIRRFDSLWRDSGRGSLIEFVNPWLGLEMRPFVQGDQLHYRGERFILRCGQRQLGLPQWLLGYTSIVETAVDTRHFAMDFRLHHPLLGEIFGYRGIFHSQSR